MLLIKLWKAIAKMLPSCHQPLVNAFLSVHIRNMSWVSIFISLTQVWWKYSLYFLKYIYRSWQGFFRQQDGTHHSESQKSVYGWRPITMLGKKSPRKLNIVALNFRSSQISAALNHILNSNHRGLWSVTPLRLAPEQNMMSSLPLPWPKLKSAKIQKTTRPSVMEVSP